MRAARRCPAVRRSPRQAGGSIRLSPALAVLPMDAVPMRATLKSLWADHRWATIGTAAVIGAVLIALVGYLVLKRPADKSCVEPCTIETTRPPKPGDQDGELAVLRPVTRSGPATWTPPRQAAVRGQWTFRGTQPSRVFADRGRWRDLRDEQQRPRVLGKKRTGKARWKPSDRHPERLRPGLLERKLFISNLDPGQVSRSPPITARMIWRRPLPGRTESSPVVVGNKVIAPGASAGDLYAFDAGTGKTIWQTPLGGRGEGGAGGSQRRSPTSGTTSAR